MERDEILKKARAQSGGLDEREQQALGSSFGFGAVLMALLCAVLAAVELLRGGQACGYAAIVFAYLAGAQVHSYGKIRRWPMLAAAAACGLACAANLILFLLG